VQSYPLTAAPPAPLPPQLLVEQYFSSRIQLNSYWVGIKRAASTEPYLLADFGTVEQLASESPYGHWSQQHMAALVKNSTAAGSCVAALSNATYDRYTGDATAAQQTSAAFYQTNGTLFPDRKYGWMGLPCESTALAFICQIAAPLFPCLPPPSTNPPPPQPPSPPSPPLPPTCAPVNSSYVLCDSMLEKCFAYNITKLSNFADAAANCQLRGGDLVQYTSHEKQLKVRGGAARSAAADCILHAAAGSRRELRRCRWRPTLWAPRRSCSTQVATGTASPRTQLPGSWR
jgi:hypothetical protein